jgi:hypothetical protein
MNCSHCAVNGHLFHSLRQRCEVYQWLSLCLAIAPKHRKLDSCDRVCRVFPWSLSGSLRKQISLLAFRRRQIAKEKLSGNWVRCIPPPPAGRGEGVSTPTPACPQLGAGILKLGPEVLVWALRACTPEAGSQGDADFVHAMTSGLFAGVRARQVADRSVGYAAGFLPVPQ